MLNRNDKTTDLNSDPEALNDPSQWEVIMSAANIFNRMVLYRGEYYHRSILPGFGENQYNGRLFQTFFFNTEQ